MGQCTLWWNCGAQFDGTAQTLWTTFYPQLTKCTWHRWYKLEIALSILVFKYVAIGCAASARLSICLPYLPLLPWCPLFTSIALHTHPLAFSLPVGLCGLLSTQCRSQVCPASRRPSEQVSVADVLLLYLCSCDATGANDRIFAQSSVSQSAG